MKVKYAMEFASMLMLFLLLSNLAAQEKFSISGKVLDRDNHRALVGANILVKGTTSGTISDANGGYGLNLTPGRYTLLVTFIGYQPVEKDIFLNQPQLRVNIELIPQVLRGQEIQIEAARAKERETPVVFTDIGRKEIQHNYSVQDIPLLINEIPGVYSYADAGSSIGYSYLKIRGFDQKRVSVMINGIPLNDPEDHQVYWVDMPDFAASIEDIQIQRGVGSSLYGTASFGGTVNIITTNYNLPYHLGVTTGYGSYHTRKFTFNLNSGKLHDNYAFAARFSKVNTDSYRNNAAVNLWAYFLSGAIFSPKTTLKINVYGGPEVTHAAWEGSPESALKKNHRHNPLTYHNSIDSFNQPHYELLHAWQVTPHLLFSNTFFYIHGIGYYELFKSAAKLFDYGYLPFYTSDSTYIDRTALVRQKWVKKDQIGWISRLDWKHRRGTFTFGVDTYTFWSTHWGNVLWAEQLPPGSAAAHVYHRYQSHKDLGTIFIHELFRLGTNLTIMGDVNLQFQKYKFRQKKAGNFTGANLHIFDVNYSFLNPRVGVNYNFNDKMNIFANVSVGHLEPADADLFDTWQGPDDLGVPPLFKHSDTVRTNRGDVKYIRWRDPRTQPEQLLDYEFGIGYLTDRAQAKVNVYWMDFRNEIVPFSQTDDDGFPIKGNAGKTIHRGIELDLSTSLVKGLSLSGSASLSENYFVKFKQYDALYDDDWNFVGSKTIDYSGKTIAGFPGIMANGKLSYALGPFMTHLQLQHIGKQYLDNSEKEERTISAYTLINWKLGYRISAIPGVKDASINLWVNNILNVLYETAGYYDSWAGENYLWPGAERNYYVSLEVGL